ncbi:MAG: hypothetical protein IKS17_01250 [Firmicutes bacterium]|nr:hypothetical protein [Bacillota bacterium]
MKKFISGIVSLSMLFGSFGLTNVHAAPTVTSGSGFESVWGEFAGSGDYNAYVSENGTDFTKTDTALIRTDGSGNYRVEPLGLKGNTEYTVKVVPVANGTENEAEAFTFTAFSKSYDRSGYAFFGTTNAPGAYLSDGTLPSNADVIYVNDANKNTVSLYGKTGLSNVLDAHSKQSRPLVVRIIGKINASGFSGLDSTKMTETKGTAGLTIEGVGTDASFYTWGIKIAHAADVEIRNITFDTPYEDATEIQESTHVWIHDNTYTQGFQDPPKEYDKNHGDGSCDAKRSDYVTISYNRFTRTAKTCLLGSSAKSREDVGHYSYHHNFFDNAEQRLPRIRWHDVHIYNNYYKNVGYAVGIHYDSKYNVTAHEGDKVGYGIGATCNSSVFAENNYFENTYRPMLTSDKNCGSLSSNDGGVIKAYGNYIDEYSASTMEKKDYFAAPSKDYKLTAADYTCTLGGWTYDNFDTSDKFYTDNYFLETAENCKTTVEENAGSEKNTTGLVLNNAINGSSTGGGGTGDPDDPIDPDDPVDPHPTDPGVNIDCTYYYDFPSSGSTAASFGGENGSGTFFTADKGLSASGKTGTVTVNGKTYTFEGVGGFANNGTIKFTAEKNGTLNIVSCSGSTTQRKLVVTNSAGKEVGTILSGTSSQDSAAALALEAGSYTVTNKGGGEAKLYYIGYKNDGETPQNDEMIGDADLDNMITASDALMVLQYTLAPMTTDANFVKRCDVDKDNFITATDASIILQATLTEKLVLQ